MSWQETAARRITKPFVVLAATLAVCFAFAATAQAAPNWTPPINLGSAKHEFNLTQNAQVALDESGDAVAVWVSGVGTASRVWASSKPVGGSWSNRVAISATGIETQNVQVGIDAEGNATAVWETIEAEEGESGIRPGLLVSATKPKNGSWSSQVLVGPFEVPCGCDAEMEMAVSREGVATVVWDSLVAGENQIFAATSTGSNEWSLPTQISASAEAQGEPDVAIDGAGNATAVWYTQGELLSTIEESTQVLGSWSPPNSVYSLEENTAMVLPRVALDEAGDGAVVWLQSGETTNIINAVTKPAGGPWSAPTQISNPEAESLLSFGPDVGLDAVGDATAVWPGHEGTPPTIFAAEAFGGEWGSARSLVPPSEAFNLYPDVAVANDGKAIVVWDAMDEGDLTMAAIRPPGGSWEEPEVLSSNNGEEMPTFPSVAINAAGSATVVWDHFTGEEEQYVVQSSDTYENIPLTVRKVGLDNGTVASTPSGINCGPSCHRETAFFEPGEEVVLSASAEAGYTFVGWSNCDEPAGAFCRVVPSMSHEPVGAEFRRLVKVTVEKDGSGIGTVQSTPAGINCTVGCLEASSEFRAGQSVTLTAKAGKNSTFTGWSLSSGSCALSEEGRKCTFTPRENITAEATFNAATKFNLTVSKQGEGQGLLRAEPGNYSCGVSCGSLQTTYYTNGNVQITATPKNGAKTLTWIEPAGTCVDHARTCEVPVSAEELTVAFE